MKKEPHAFFRESGYLASPASRFLWAGASPTLRSHLRLFLLLWAGAALPLAGLMAGLTHLTGHDRLLLFAFYALTLLVPFLLFDLAAGGLVRIRALAWLWKRTWPVNGLPVALGILFFIGCGLYLKDTILERRTLPQLMIWLALGLCCRLAASSCHLLVVSRLYWHGLQPPRFRHFPLLATLAGAAILAFYLLRLLPYPAPALTPLVRPPTLLLAFDVAEPYFDSFQEVLPAWERQSLTVAESDITSFWTGLMTGTTKNHHKASLLKFQSPLFRRNLDRRDPTQRLPLWLFQAFSRARPLAESGRYRKFLWEILDDYGLRTFSYAFWHTFPASSQNGGVLTERWSPDCDNAPYISGFSSLPARDGLPLFGPVELHPTIQRENQTWTQLLNRAGRDDFDLTVAYFPLSDLLTSLPPAERAEVQRQVAAFRGQMLQRLLGSLPESVKVGIFIASGKEAAAINRIQVSFLTNWLPWRDSFSSPLQFAPTVLNYYGLPPDRYMQRLSVDAAPVSVQTSIDYGEPERLRISDTQLDTHYYQLLKSLGYVQ